MICASCQPPDLEHDTCLNILRTGACGCSCQANTELWQPPAPAEALFVFMNHNPPSTNGRRRGGQRPAPPWPPGFHCGQHHLIEGDNAYWDEYLRRWLCRTCRQASWRRSKRRAYKHKETE